MGNVTLTRIGSNDAFVAKLDAKGAVIWAKNFGGSGTSIILVAIALDSASTPNVYVTGNFNSGNVSSPALTAIGTSDGVLIKLSSADGTTTWAKNYGGAGASIQLSGIAVDGLATPNVYVVGGFADANMTTPALTKITTANYDGLVLKVESSAGVTQWGNNYGGASAQLLLYGVAVDTAGTPNVYVCGRYTSGALTTPSLAKTGNRDGLAMKIPGNGGAPTWSQHFFGTGSAQLNLYGIALDTAATPNLYLAGWANANLSTPSVTKIGASDVVVIKMASTGGAETWVQNFGGAGADFRLWAMAIDQGTTPNIYLSGSFAGANLTTPALTLRGIQDAVLMKLPNSGGSTPTFVESFGGSGADVNGFNSPSLQAWHSVSVDTATTPNVFLGGAFVTASMTNPAFPLVGSSTNAFVLKYGQPTLAPDPPTNVSGSAGNGRATIAFTAPIYTGGAISSYTATASPGGATGSCSGPAACTINVNGLANGTAYTFTVTATNSVGTGNASTASGIMTPTFIATNDTPPPFLGKISDVAPINFVVAPVSGSSSTGTATAQLPSTVFTNTSGPLSFTLGAINVGNAAAGTSAPLTIQVPANSQTAPGQSVSISFDPIARRFSLIAPVVVRSGARIEAAKAKSAAAAPATFKAGTGTGSGTAAPILAPFQVTGPRALVVSTTLLLTGTDAKGNSGTVKIPVTLYLPGETADLVAISVDPSNGFGLTGSATPVLSRDGQTTSFLTTASNLGLAFSTPLRQVVRYCVPLGQVDFISQSSFGGGMGGSIAAGGESMSPALSADGSILAFASDGRNIYPVWPEANFRQVYTISGTGIVDGTVSTRSPRPLLLNGQGVMGTADAPSVSSNGSLIAFTSSAVLVEGVTGGVSQVYVRNTANGAIALVSSDALGVAANGAAINPSMSDDGRYVLFASSATNLGSQSSVQQIYLKNRTTGAVTLVSADASGNPGNAASTNARLSADGAYAVFESDATNLTATSKSAGQIYFRALASGTTVLITQSASGAPAGGSMPALSGDGRFVVFKSAGANLVAGVAPTTPQIYVRDMFAGTTRLVSSDINGKAANGASDTPVISGDGRTIAFSSLATNLDGTATNNVSQVYLAANPISAPVANGLWINPNLTGQYYLVEQAGDKVFFANLGFSADTAPTWSIATEAALGTAGYSGPLTLLANGQTLAGSFQSPNVGAVLGTASLVPATPTSGVITQPTGTASAQRWGFGAGGAAAGQATGYPETGWWWNAAEPGRALFLEVQGTSLYASLLGYNLNGSATWYQAQGMMNSPTAFAGALNICTSATTPLCATSAGNIAINFTSTLAGTLTLPNGNSIPIQRFRF
jgi:Tol biopolymer transport system component